MQHLRRRLICSTGVVACGLIAACVTAPELSPPQGAATVPARDLKAGQYWEYAVHDAYTGLPRGVYRYTVARLDATQAVVDVIQDGVHVDAYVYAPGWNPIEQPLTNLQRFRYKPPFPRPIPPAVRPAGRPEQVKPDTPLPGPPPHAGSLRGPRGR